jgi:fluoride exporter
MKTILVIGLGSFAGGIGRYLLSQTIQSKMPTIFPLGTLAVNVIGCFIIGIVFGVSSKGNLNSSMQFFLMTGILGGFTTFSAFSLETVNLMKEGQVGVAFGYVALSLVLGFAGTFGGLSMAKIF